MNRIWLGLALLLTLSVPLWGQNSQGSNSQGGPVIVDQDATLYGRGYSEWDAEWQQWADSIPVANHPLFQTTETARSRPVRSSLVPWRKVLRGRSLLYVQFPAQLYHSIVKSDLLYGSRL